ncbi:Hsp70 family protein [Sandaracinus amylolyticus]|uniref:Chaperone protein DnaK n=1 Tax=Sandaracinus amylolyticus TaxID=927083 RepID=A0A0F6YI77_9BACT|nr:Hsp70 family protein [Sandaracinus amylolyticus]AKF06688.1 Chaperone protein DnaK [Sandaracinus amylolyticus]
MASPVLGIDLGTTNSVVAVAEGQRAQVLMDAEGNRLIPSVVSFHPAGDVLVGYPARERRLLDAKNTIYSVKRLIGRPFRGIEVQRAQERFPFALTEAPNQGVTVQARGEAYTLPEISAFVLREVRRIAEQALGTECTRAVITVPANFTELQRSATKAAGKIAGLEVLRILNEPTAAALAYGYGRGSRERIAIYDMGGGTFDVTILELAGDVFEVMATAGDTFLGGDDVDVLIAEKMADAFLAHHRFDPRQDPQAYERLRAAAEWSKCQLSSEEEVHLRVEELAYGEGGVSLDLTFGLARDALEQMVRPLISRTFDVCEEAMRTAGLRPTQLDNVILVGGSTRMPIVRRMVADYFGREPLSTIDPDLVVAQGAALQGWALRGSSASVPPPAALGKVALKRVTQTELKAVQRRTELKEEIAAQRPVGPAFQPREQPPAPPRVPAPSAPAAHDSWLGPRTSDEDETLVRRSPFERSSPPPPLPGKNEPAAVPPPPPMPAKSAPKPPPPAAAIPGVVAARSVVVGNKADGPRPVPPPAPASAVVAPPVPQFRDPPSAPQVKAREPTHQFRTDDTPAALPAAQPTQPIASGWSSPPPPASVRPPLLLDVTPHSLGVETVGGYCEHVIKRNAAIPVEQTRVFSTATDMQDSVRVRVVQGESRRLEDNQPLGEIELSGLRQALRGAVKIGVTFLMDADGTLGVKAKDLDTGREQSIRIQLVGGMSDAEIQKMAARQQQMVG